MNVGGSRRIKSTADVAANSIEQADLGDDAVGLPEIKAGTPGAMIAYDASGNPVEIPPGTSGQILQSSGADTPVWASGTDLGATAGEAIADRDAVYLADGSETVAVEVDQSTSNTNVSGDLNASTKRILQSFTFPASPSKRNITGATWYFAKAGSPTGNINCSLYADNGSDRPTGAALASSDVAYAGIAAGPGVITFTFATPYVATPGTKYILVLNPGAGVSGAAYPNPYGSTNDQIAGTGAYSTDSGATYTNGSGGGELGSGDDWRFQVLTAPEAGKMYRTDASDASWTHNFVGFAKAAAAYGATCTAQLVGVMTGMTGLTPGATYYLSDTTGAIGSSAGSTSRKVGVALTATTLLIKNDNV